MGQDSKIEWTTHTFNPWRGCTKVSTGCANCYAEKLSHRNPKSLGIWGDNGTRVVASESGWKEPPKWDRLAKEAGERHRVFCASLADVFEDRSELRAPRLRLLDLIRQTPHLDWLLLTKRPENIQTMIEESLILSQGGDPDDKHYFEDRDGSFPENDLAEWLNDWSGDAPPANVWLGTSCENQATADERIPHLLRCPAAVRFLSLEPLLGALDLLSVGSASVLGCPDPSHRVDVLRLGYWSKEWGYTSHSDLSADCGHHGIDWVIVGGESGPGARPMHPRWARSLRDQCQAAGVAFFFKQWGEFRPFGDYPEDTPAASIQHCEADRWRWIDLNGDSEWTLGCDGRAPIVRVGKKAAGRLLDGREWNELPGVPVTR